MRLFVVIPAHNEEKTIGEVIRGVKKYTQNIIVVDDGSKDKTPFAAKRAFEKTVLLRHRINLGKGAALKTGCEAAIKLGAEIILTIDADGQHLPEDIPGLIKKLTNDKLDVIFSIRKFNKKMPLLRSLGNKFLTKLINHLTKVSLSDTQSGLRAFTSKAYQKIFWQASDYSVETEIILKVGRNNLKYGQVPIQTVFRDVYKGITIFDGIKIFFNLLKQKFL